MEQPQFTGTLPRHHVAVVTTPDEIDINNEDELRDVLLAASADATILVIDMTATTFCGASGVNAFAWIRDRLCETGGELRVACVAPAIRRVLAVTKLDLVLHLYPSVPAALGIRPWHLQPAA